MQFSFERGDMRRARFAVPDGRLTLDPPTDTEPHEPGNYHGRPDDPRLGRMTNIRRSTARLSTLAATSDRVASPSPRTANAFYSGPNGRCGSSIGTAPCAGGSSRRGGAWAVTITPDGRTAIAGFGDGTLRWYRLEDGVELLAFFPHADGKRWVLWTPEGYYQASVGGEDLIGGHLNRGLDTAPEFFGASRFRDEFYRPDVIARVLTTLDGGEALRLADQARGQPTRPRDVRTTLPPRVQNPSPAPGTTTTSPRAHPFLQGGIRRRPDHRHRTAGALAARCRKRDTSKSPHRPPRRPPALSGMLAWWSPRKKPTVEIIARNPHGSSEPASFVSAWVGGADYAKPALYVLAIGVSSYQRRHCQPEVGRQGRPGVRRGDASPGGRALQEGQRPARS